MTSKNIAFGRLGEDIARDYLIRLGHSILFQNYRNRVGEIDIISVKEEVLYCTEVKYRKTRDGFHPLQTFNVTKRDRMKKLYYYLIQEKPEYSHLTASFCLAHINEKREVCFYSHLF